MALDLQTALVTGATGFIGRRLVPHLVRAGVEVRCLVRETSDTSALAPLGIERIVGDIRDPDSLARAAEGVDAVFHLAALLRMPWKPAFAEVNAAAVGHVAAACAAQPEPPALLVLSSAAAAGPVPSGGQRVERDAPAPVSRYGEVKLDGEQAAARYAGHVPLTIIRPPMVFGDGDHASLPLFRMARRGWCLAPSPHPMSMIHVDDLADLLLRAARDGERVTAAPELGRGVYNAAAPEVLTLADFSQRIARVLGRPPLRVLPVPRAALWLTAAVGEALGRLRDTATLMNLDKAREALGGSWACDARKATIQLGWRHAELDARLSQTIEWYRGQGWLAARESPGRY